MRNSREESGRWSAPWPYLVAGVCLVVLKLWLVSGQHMFAIGYASIDDRLFINLANNLINFQWLGAYDDLTLAKGPFYPLWIAGSYFLHVPLFYAEHLLYLLACLVVVMALRPILPRPWQQLVLFALLVFNPGSFADGPMTRVVREGIYPAALLCVGLFLGLLLSIRGNLRHAWLWSIGAGVALSCFWLTREEGVWILPFVMSITLYAGWVSYRKRRETLGKRFSILLLPFLVLGIALGTVSAINYSHYKVFTVVEFKEANFLAAYGALTRVKPPVWYADVPVTAEQRRIVYSISPAFARLRPSLEGVSGINWSKNGNPSEPGEIKGGWFMWAFRDAVAGTGAYVDGATASAFYGQMADEINTACDAKQIDCLPRNDSMVSPWDNRYLSPFLQAFSRGVSRTVSFDGLSPNPSTNIGDKQSLKLFDVITRGKVSAKTDASRVSILEMIRDLYGLSFPFLTFGAMATLVYGVFRRRISVTGAVIIFAVAASFCARIFILALIDATSFPGIDPLYLSSAYPLLIVGVLSGLFLVFETDPHREAE